MIAAQVPAGSPTFPLVSIFPQLLIVLLRICVQPPQTPAQEDWIISLGDEFVCLGLPLPLRRVADGHANVGSAEEGPRFVRLPSISCQLLTHSA